MNGITVNGNAMENRTHGCIHTAFFHGFKNALISEFLGADHGKRAEGVGVRVSVGILIVVIVRAVAENMLTRAEHFVVKGAVVFQMVDEIRALVAHFDAEKPLVRQNLRFILHRPIGVIVSDDITVLLGGADIFIDIVRCVFARSF